MIPTETVYGLGARMRDPLAVASIFRAKGRPANHPLIVHLHDLSQLGEIAASWPEYALELAANFWPGPLTLVLPKRSSVPDEVTGGLDTVAVRIPNHPLTLALLRELGEPVVAPSANLFTEVSPTRIEHLSPKLLDSVAMVLDGGPSEVGIESTVLDCTLEEPVILRPGSVGSQDIQEAIGLAVGTGGLDEKKKSPGHHPRHYAPQVTLHLTDEPLGDRPGLGFALPTTPFQICMPGGVPDFARALYDALHQLDRMGIQEAWIQAPPRTGDWEAVWDRLTRATHRV